MLTRQELVPNRRGTPILLGPKDQQNKTDKFLSVFGAIYTIVISKKNKGKVLKNSSWKTSDHVDLIKRIEEMQEKYRQTIKEKDAAIALLNDDLQNRDNQIQAIQYENVTLQAQRDVYKDQLQNVKTS